MNFKKGDKVYYNCSNEKQQGIHKVLKVDNDLIILDNFYSNGNIFIVGKDNFHCLEKVEGEENEE